MNRILHFCPECQEAMYLKGQEILICLNTECPAVAAKIVDGKPKIVYRDAPSMREQYGERAHRT